MSKKEQITTKDIMQLEPIDKLDEEELALHRELQKGNFILHTDDATKEKYAKIFKRSNLQ